MPETPRAIYGIPVVLSKTVDTGSVYVMGPPIFPGGPPELARLKGVRIDAEDNVIQETEAE